MTWTRNSIVRIFPAPWRKDRLCSKTRRVMALEDGQTGTKTPCRGVLDTGQEIIFHPYEVVSVEY